MSLRLGGSGRWAEKGCGVRPIGGVWKERGGIEALGEACVGCDEMGWMV